MPIVHVRGVARDDAATHRGLVQVADSVAQTASCPVEDVWCTFTPVPAMTLGRATGEAHNQILYVDLIMRPRGAEAVAATLEAAARAAAKGFEVPVADVWARLVELRPHTVFAGGRHL